MLSDLWYGIKSIFVTNPEVVEAFDTLLQRKYKIETNLQELNEIINKLEDGKDRDECIALYDKQYQKLTELSDLLTKFLYAHPFIAYDVIHGKTGTKKDI